MNSAGADGFFATPMSLGSLLYPMLTRPLRFGAEIGPIALNAIRPMLDLIAQGTLKTDGSEQHVGFTNDPTTGQLVAHPRTLVESRDYIHDDFASFQDGKPASKLTEEYYVFRKTAPDQNTP
ncbi:hypothetical protein PIB19_05995 [Sphingomonas sp. 7/4-4]|uniref:hypothetical protein n=1 Tax=Sphingomonas sp. 7/4-4 TaxID=3018446 RepID=UPI0022F3EE5B|nr:hypothetical protein [Sphingomonas sp. 7/4-4]WBY08948.1 hypothetical protein PIB19_05995 [Sphingomonas sp. 7/4-4]